MVPLFHTEVDFSESSATRPSSAILENERVSLDAVLSPTEPTRLVAAYAVFLFSPSPVIYFSLVESLSTVNFAAFAIRLIRSGA